jgi:2-keto-4-pentenoate hydratase/2-oxohepta-3-ene-1,7-dioic acid hydratase in catechol pathway
MSPRPELIGRYLAEGIPRIGRRERGAWTRLDGYPWQGGRVTGEHDEDAAVTLLPPVVPTKIVCVGLNYRAHAAESASVVAGTVPAEEPLLFLKPPSAVIAGGEPIRYPAGVTRLDPEAELAVVIGRRARHLGEHEVREVVAGITCFNDVSARNHQRRDGQWTRAKGFDTFAPLGPWIATGVEPEGRAVTCRVNGEVRQRGDTSDLIFAVPSLIAFVSRIMTLEPGDVIATGTPAGVAPIEIGDRVEIEVEGVGVLANRVAADA